MRPNDLSLEAAFLQTCQWRIMTLTIAQCRAARGLLDWTQTDLARFSGLSLETIRNFETGRHKPYGRTLDIIQRTLDEHRVQLVFEGGIGVILRDK